MTPPGIVGIYLRMKLKETPVFQELEDSAKEEKYIGAEFKDLLRRYRARTLELRGFAIVLNGVNCTLLSCGPTYLESAFGLSTDTTLLVQHTRWRLAVRGD